MRYLPCSVRSEMRGLSFFFLLFPRFKPPGALTVKGASSDKGSPRLVPALLGAQFRSSQHTLPVAQESAPGAGFQQVTLQNSQRRHSVPGQGGDAVPDRSEEAPSGGTPKA